DDDVRQKRRLLIEGIPTLSHQMDCTVIAEGIEIAFSSEPLRSPESVRASSRLARVAGSMNRGEAALSRSGFPSGGRSASGVFST
ncbi:hypothetical protein ACCS72_37790, partial [Rhizobium ruizarguesonis]